MYPKLVTAPCLIASAICCVACSFEAGERVLPNADAPLDAAPTTPDAMPDGITDAMPVAGVPYVYVASSDGSIRVFSIDFVAGSLGKPTAFAIGAVPAFLALSPNGKLLFAIDADKNLVLSFAIDRQTGGLKKIDQRTTGNNGPQHVSVDQTGKWVLVAHYDAGTYAVFGVGIDGNFSGVADSGIVGTRAHYIATDRTNKYAVVPCMGADYVAIRPLDATTGKLSAAAPPPVALPAGTSPRHLAFSPDAKFAYVNGTANNTVSTLSFDETTGAMAVIDTATTLPANFSGANTTAEVLVHPNGNYVYVSNRGHNSIARYRRDATTGKLTLLGHSSSRGDTPRSITIDSSGQVLIAANQDSGSLAVFKINSATGDLAAMGDVITVKAPNYVGILDIQ